MKRAAPLARKRAAHSAEHFGPERDFWWNDDFLALTARRLELRRVRRVLDVGSGVGHWGRVLLPHVHPDARLVGVDPESRWVSRARALATARGLGARTEYLRATAETLPFPDGEFDLVTCQTVLIHVAEPARAIAEMVRVTRPGGRLLLVEPNNVAASLIAGSTTFDAPTDERLDLVRLQLVCERGKSALGEGNDSLGDIVPGLLLRAGVVDVDVTLSDRATPLVPPYRTPDQRAARAQILRWARTGYWLWRRDDAYRYFVAGGGTPAEFDRCWEIAQRTLANTARDLRARTYHTAGGGVVYLISARRAKP